MKLLTLEQHRTRKNNILYAETKVKSYLRRERIHNYIPGQVIYNLGDTSETIDLADKWIDRQTHIFTL